MSAVFGGSRSRATESSGPPSAMEKAKTVIR